MGENKAEKFGDAIERFGRAIKGEHEWSWKRPFGEAVPVQNVVLVLGLGYLAFKVVETYLKER